MKRSIPPITKEAPPCAAARSGAPARDWLSRVQRELKEDMNSVHGNAERYRRIGMNLLLMQKRKGFKKLGYSDLWTWSQAFCRCGETWGKRLMHIAQHFSKGQLRNKDLTLEALEAVAAYEPPYRHLLVRYGSGLDAATLKHAVTIARLAGGDDVAKGAEALKSALNKAQAGEPLIPPPPGSPPVQGGPSRRSQPRGAGQPKEQKLGLRLIKLLDEEAQVMKALDSIYAAGGRLSPELEKTLHLSFTGRNAWSQRFEPRITGAGERRSSPREVQEPGPAEPAAAPAPAPPPAPTVTRPAAAAPAAHAAPQVQPPAAPAPTDPPAAPAAPADSPAAPAAPAGPVAAIRPPLYTQHHIALPVPFPSYDEQPGEVDRLMGSFITAMAEFGRLSSEALGLVNEGVEMSNRLQFHLMREVQLCREERLEIVPLIEDVADQGQCTLEQWLAEDQKEDPALLLEDLYPLCTSPALAATVVPMDWVVYDASPPFLLPEANHLEKLLMRMLGLTRWLRELFPRFHALHATDPDYTYVLAYQFLRAVKSYHLHTCRFMEQLNDNAEAGMAEEAQLGQLDQQRAAEREYAKRYIVTVGDLSLPRRYVIIGRLQEGRLVAVSTARPHLVLLVGNGGQGKTHFIRLMSEGSAMGLNGLSQIGTEPTCVVDFTADWTAGQANHASLNGLHPNPDPAAHQRLRDIYGADTSNVAYRRQELFCLPHTGAHYRALYPELVERGLEPVEVVFNDAELNHFNLSVMAGLADVRHRTRAHQWFDAMVAQYGPELKLPLLLAELERSDLDSGSQGRLMRNLVPLLKLRSQTEWLIDRMEDPCIKSVILESEWMPMELLVPIKIAMMNAMCRQLRNGQDPPRLYGLDELLKFLACPGMMRFLELLGTELRHRPLTLVLAAQRVTGIPRRLVALGTIFGTLHMSNPAEFRRWQGQVGGLSGVSYEEQVKPLQPGQILLTGLEASDPRLVQQALWVEMRDTAIDPGGQTCRAD